MSEVHLRACERYRSDSKTTNDTEHSQSHYEDPRCPLLLTNMALMLQLTLHLFHFTTNVCVMFRLTNVKQFLSSTVTHLKLTVQW